MRLSLCPGIQRIFSSKSGSDCGFSCFRGERFTATLATLAGPASSPACSLFEARQSEDGLTESSVLWWCVVK
eukprot:m.927453 g.927453  ORF g.927453 m.927453 type:complete len:72 (-) comp148993_c0_seq1:19-234(-)